MKKNNKLTLHYVLWIGLLLCLPFTSFPLIARLFGDTSVAPLSALFLFSLVFVFFLPRFLSNKILPKEALPLILFFLYAVIATLLAAFKYIPTMRMTPTSRNALEAGLTLLVGIAFYVLTIQIVDKPKILVYSLKAIYLSGLLIIIASLVQALCWYRYGNYPDWLWQFQRLVTSNGLLYEKRVTGLAYEPSWLANQLNTLYIPIWLGFTATRNSLFKFRIAKYITVENTLLILAVGSLFLSFSRIGWLTSVVVVAYVFYRITNNWINKLLMQYEKRQGKVIQFRSRLLVKFLIGLTLLLVIALITLLLGILLTKIDPRMENLFDIERYKQFGILGWASQLSFAERLIYWITAFRVYLENPILGVGFGGTGYFFADLVPDFGYKLPEVIRAAGMDNFIPNAKNLWVRILSETGIIGVAFFLSWFYIHYPEAKNLEKKVNNPMAKTMGLVGKLFLLAIITEGFSIDSYGLPYIWIALGLTVSAFRVNQQTSKNAQLLPWETQGEQ